MKRVYTFLTIILLVTAGCGENTQSSGDFITVDITKSYPKKELILQDFMDVEYIALETTDEFLNQGGVLAVGKEVILVRNQDDGDIFVYNRTGKGLRKINHLGRGPQEYMSISAVILDEDNGELFVIDLFNRILVYDLSGGFKRSFNSKESTRLSHPYNYDNDNFICLGEPPFDPSSTSSRSFLIISKHDGSITNEIQIPYIEEKALGGVQIKVDDNGGWIMSTMTTFFYPLIPYRNDWIVTEFLSDTVFTSLKDQSMRPFITRTPPRKKISHATLLFPGILSDRYSFMASIKEDVSTKPMWPIPNNPVMTVTNLAYDRQQRAIFTPTVYNGDFSDKREVSMFQKTADNSEVAFWLSLEAPKLINDLKKGLLKGSLKEIAEKLDEDDNPVIMLVKYKN